MKQILYDLMNLIHPWKGPDDEQPSEEFRKEQRTIVILLMIMVALGLIGMHYMLLYVLNSSIQLYNMLGWTVIKLFICTLMTFRT